MAGEWGDVLQALGLSTPDTGEPTAPPSALQTQVAGFPARGGNMLLSALGPLGEAGMTLGEMLRTRQFDSRLLPQIAGGVLLGTAAPSGLETGEIEAAAKNLVDLPASKAAQILFGILPVEAHAPILAAMAKETGTTPVVIKQQLLDAGPRKANFGDVPGTPSGGLPIQPSLSDAAISAKLAANPGASIFDLAGHSEMGPKYKMPEPPEPEDYSDYLVPIEDWSALRGPHGSAEFEDVGTRERARESGFNVDLPLYKGGGFQNYPVSLSDPARKSWEKGTFFSPEPEIAGTYTHSGGIPLEYVARSQKPVEIDWPSATGLPDYSSSHMGDIISSARKQGADMLVIRNMHDQGGKQDQYVVLDPSIVRQPGAQFDPAKLHWNELAAGLAGAGAIPALAHEEGQQE